MQLKRDTVCDSCGRMTARAKRNAVLWVVQLFVVGGAVLYAYGQITSLATRL
jgi:hypothetical protein